MKIAPFAVTILIAFMIFSSGCISLGTQTTDIVMGGESVGKIYVTPNNDKLLSNSSITDKFDMKVDLFGFSFSKEGITQTEADSIIDKISSGIESSADLSSLGFDLISSTEPDSFDEIINQIVNMPVSAKDDTKVSEFLNFNKAFAGFEELAQKMMSFFNLKS